MIVGKTNCDEFAMGSSNENSAFGPVHNPWALDRTPGGSSGGSAVTVAAGLVPTALGSDTGGSIRQPAAFCGVVGLKPTYGRVSRYGLLAFASSLDQIGPFTHTAEDAALVLQAIAGADPLDATAATVPVDDYAAALTGEVAGLRIGVPRGFVTEGVDADVLRAFDDGARGRSSRAGPTLVDIELPHAGHAIPVYYLIATAEASSNLARYDGVRYGYRATLEPQDGLRRMYERTRDEGFGPEVKRRIMLGTYVLSAGYYDAYYLKAQQVRTLIRRDYEQAFAHVDAVAMPTAPTPAFRLGEKASDPLQMYLADIFTVSANLAGLPAISVPCGMSGEGLPTGPAVDRPRVGRGDAAARRRRLPARHAVAPTGAERDLDSVRRGPNLVGPNPSGSAAEAEASASARYTPAAAGRLTTLQINKPRSTKGIAGIISATTALTSAAATAPATTRNTSGSTTTPASRPSPPNRRPSAAPAILKTSRNGSRASQIAALSTAATMPTRASAPAATTASMARTRNSIMRVSRAARACRSSGMDETRAAGVPASTSGR